MDIQPYLPQLHKLFAKQGVILAYLFGSQAGSKAGPLSDVDIAVLFKRSIPYHEQSERQINLIADLMSLFHRNDVDVVILNRATPLLAHQVIKHGQVTYEPDRLARVRFEVAAFRRYVDTKPLRKLQERYLAWWIAERRKARLPSEFVW